MRETIRRFVHIASAMLPFRLLRSGKLPVLLPFYHLVSNDELPYRMNYHYPSVATFESDLDFLLQHYKPVGLDELLSGKSLTKAFHLSFDDGLRECYDVVAPILKRKGVPATFFVNPAFVDNQDLFHRYKVSEIAALLKEKNIHISLQNTYADLDSLDELAADLGLNWHELMSERQPYMTTPEIRSLQQDGFTIGGHSMDHPEFWLLDEESQLEEIRESMAWINQTFAPQIKAFAFPFSDVGVPDCVFEACHEERLFDVSFGTAGLKRERMECHFQRVPMETDQPATAAKRLKAEYLAFQLKRLINRHYAKRH
ncbi:polysaccharide deacetylase family protein [Gaoshiqia sediminis]|uniref:Polysaccharide deacetylase family protein n=1 Tax=Gaoshiqia sediminis TaxID=2986998 RepID=A0AA41Y7T7_9BACT|nr:polysaccharide deacetylase family protein [Gaoshiqia sediminis]MCW0482707.1 polysaccharide deacetylase family protein [Gaoshiqia sediminis]